MHVVAELLQRLTDRPESSAAILVRQPLDVFAEDHAGVVAFANLSYIKKERTEATSLVVVVEAHASTGHGKDQARDPIETNVEVGNHILLHFCISNLSIFNDLPAQSILLRISSKCSYPDSYRADPQVHQ